MLNKSFRQSQHLTCESCRGVPCHSPSGPGPHGAHFLSGESFGRRSLMIIRLREVRRMFAFLWRKGSLNRALQRETGLIISDKNIKSNKKKTHLLLSLAKWIRVSAVTSHFDKN